VKEYAKSLKSSVEVWYQILNPEISSFDKREIFYLEKLNRIGIEPVAPLIMVFFQKEKAKEKRIILLERLERLMFFMFLIRQGYFIDIDRKFFIELSSKLTRDEVDSDKVLDEVASAFENGAKNKRAMEYIKDNFKRSGFYKWSGIKYFLYEYDLYLKEKSKTHREKLVWNAFVEEDSRDHYTIEHIYPQNPRKKCWTEQFGTFSTNERNSLRHSLGNLLPLSRAKNSSFQNNCFYEKLGDESNKVGYRFGSYSENEVACKSQWTANDILERGVTLLVFMEERWGVTIGDRAEKVRFLNLGFMEKKKKK